MYIKLFRNAPQGNALTGRLVINGRWFCNTLERVGYQIPALCYHIAVTQSPKFKRLLPLVCNVPRLPLGGTPSNSEASNRAKPVQYPAAECRTGIRIHRGTRPEHSTGCILVVADTPSRARELIGAEVVENNTLISHPFEQSASHVDNNTPSRARELIGAEVVDVVFNNKNIGCRSAADIENHLTQLLFQAQNAHEEIILEVTDFRPGTEYGYNTPCPSELQKR